MEGNKIKKKDWIGIIVLLIIIGGVWFMADYFSLRTHFEEISRTGPNGFGPWTPVVFVLSYIALIISMVPSAPLNVVAGILFGSFLGAFYSWLGVLLGGSASFLLARYFGESFVSRIVKEKSDVLDRYNQKIEKGGTGVVFLFRIIPLFPIGGFNYLFGLTKMKFRSYFVGSAIGIIPGILILTFLGDSISRYHPVKIGTALVLLALMGVISWKYRKKQQAIEEKLGNISDSN